jgi:hypothetical protein
VRVNYTINFKANSEKEAITEGVEIFNFFNQYFSINEKNDVKKYYKIENTFQIILKSIDEKFENISSTMNDILNDDYSHIGKSFLIWDVNLCKKENKLPKSITWLNIEII